MGEEGDDLVHISALQHQLFCPRQCALIHVERLWAENAAAPEGRVAHDRVHAPKGERRRGVRTVTGLPLRSTTLRLTGVADVIELATDGGRRTAFPVEHKLGRPKAHRADEVQLCAQAVCLEEMLGVEVPAGAIFYGRTRRRQDVAFDAELRALTARVAAEVHATIAAGRTPIATYDPARCDACSLIELCRPKALGLRQPVDRWLSRLIEDGG